MRSIGEARTEAGHFDSVVAYLTKTQLSRVWFISARGLALVILPLGRTLSKRILKRFGRSQRPTVILGAWRNAQEAARALRTEPLVGLEPVEFLMLKGKTLPAGAGCHVNRLTISYLRLVGLRVRARERRTGP